MITELIAHLAAELIDDEAEGPTYKLVRHSWFIKPDEDARIDQLPALLLYPGNESSVESNADNRVRQRNDRQVNVYTVCKHKDLDVLRAQLFAAALGFQASEHDDALEHSSGQTVLLSGDLIYYLDTFTYWRMLSES